MGQRPPKAVQAATTVHPPAVGQEAYARVIVHIAGVVAKAAAVEYALPLAAVPGSLSHDLRVRSTGGGAHLHYAHRATTFLPIPTPGVPPRALATDRATDSNRVGSRQQPPPGGLGDPCKLRSSSGASVGEAATAARHPSAGAAAPRPNGWSSAGNPCVSRLAVDSTARSYSVRAPEKARRHVAPPGMGIRAGIGSTAGHPAESSCTVTSLPSRSAARE